MRHLTWWPMIAWGCSAPWHQRPPDWRIYDKWQPTAITLWCSSVIYQQHHNVMISACHQPVNGIGVYTAVARWSSMAVALCQSSRVTPCLVIGAVSPPGGAWQRRLNAGGDILREKLAICAHFLPRDVASRRGWFVLTTSGGPGDGGATSCGAPFRMETGTFLFWAVHWGMSDKYIVGFARLVYCYYCWQICPNSFAVLTIFIFVWRYDTCYLLYSVQTK